MYRIIEKKIVNEYMSFKHLGMVKDGIELPPTEETKQWAGALENYRLTEDGTNTLQEMEMDVDDSFAEYFKKSFPKALEMVKKLAENG